VAERTWSREALEADDPAISLRLHARNSRRICERVADLLWAVESAAAADADAAALWADLQEQRRASMRTYARALARKTELREDVCTITETMWAMIPALYLRLVRDAGWPPDRFEVWLGETFIQLWLPQTSAARGRRIEQPPPAATDAAIRHKATEETDHDP
jgi:hypothetical protein